ncbi:MAG: glycosyltransferase family 2 protein [Candidatus Binataceae bacterium]
MKYFTLTQLFECGYIVNRERERKISGNYHAAGAPVEMRQVAATARAAESLMIPEISVIIPTYNRRLMVRDAVESVLAQRGCNFELIVVDDGSTDGTAEALEPTAAAFNENRAENAFQILRTGNRGPAAARNHGVRIARGEFIAFLDSDDLWMSDKLARQLAFMRENPSLTISQSQEIWMRNGRRVSPGRRHLKRAGDFFTDSIRTCLVSPSAVILHSAFFRAFGGFDENFIACEDYDLWLRILAGHEIGLLDEPLVIRRAGHSDQLSAATPALDRFRILALLKLLAGANLAPDRRTAVCKGLAEKCHIYAGGLGRRGFHEMARKFGEIATRASDAWRIGETEDLENTLAYVRQFVSEKSFAEKKPAEKNSTARPRTAVNHERPE